MAGSYIAKGIDATQDITSTRHELNLTSLFGCAPQTWCISCAPFGSNGSIYSVLSQALSAVVKNESRADIPRVIVLNTGSVRFDLVKGPFTYDDSFIVSPFTDAFQYIANVPYSAAVQVLPTLNAGAYEKRSISSRDFNCLGLAGGRTELSGGSWSRIQRYYELMTGDIESFRVATIATLAWMQRTPHLLEQHFEHVIGSGNISDLR